MKNLYSVRDIKAEVFCSPFVSLNDLTARRDFAHAVNDPTSALFKSPEDYSLSFVGQFNEDSGEIEPSRPVFLCQATDYVKHEE